MGDALETVAYLANSENRVRLLDALQEHPRTRAELHDETGIARATLGRILSDLEARGWIIQDGARYKATPEGSHLVTEFHTLLESVAAIDELETLVQWVPSDELGFSLGHLRGSRITRPTATDSIAPIRRAGTLLQEATEIVGLTSVFAPDALRANHDAVRNHGQEFEVVFTGTVVDIVSGDGELRRLMRELLAADTVTAYQYDGELPYPYNIWVIDGVGVMGLTDDEGAPRALIETEDRTVREWIRKTIDTYRAEATRIRPTDFSA